MAFGVVLVVLITVIAVALLITIIGYLSQIFRWYGEMRKAAREKSAAPAIAPDPDEKSSAEISPPPQPPKIKTD